MTTSQAPQPVLLQQPAQAPLRTPDEFRQLIKDTDVVLAEHRRTLDRIERELASLQNKPETA